MVRIGFCFTQRLSVNTMRAGAQAAEAGGFDICWVPEGIGKEAPTVLSSLAGSTSTIRLGTGILTVYNRTPGLMVQLALSMREIMGGRFVLGLGAGHGPALWKDHGVNLERPFRRIRDYVHVIRRTLADGRLSYEGRDITVPELSFPDPMPQGSTPIYLAALGPQMGALAGEIADGVLLNMGTPDFIAQSIAGLKDAARQAGRDPSSVEVVCQVYTGVGPSAERLARERIASNLSGPTPFYENIVRQSGFVEDADRAKAAYKEGGVEKAAAVISDRLVDEAALVGDPATWWDKAARLERSGVDVVCPFFLLPESQEDVVSAIRRMAEARN